MRGIFTIPLTLAILGLSGCITKTALDLATLPVRAASSAVDLATTSQSEKDEKRGKELREAEEKLGKLERRYSDEREDCMDGDKNACIDARVTYQEIQALLGRMPPPQAGRSAQN